MLNLVVEILEECKAEIQRNLAEQGVNASGRTSRGLVVEKYDGGVRLVATDGAPLFTTEIGRSPGKVPVGFRQIIEQWSRDKGLLFPTESDRKRFAFLTARKIAEEGTQRHKNPRADIYSPAVEKAVSELETALYKATIEAIKTH